MRIELPAKVKYVLDTIAEAGFEAYAVGGCVRDSVLGRQPNDWDITTSAMPGQIKGLFRHTIDTGIAHGTVTVMIGSEGFEVTTYRIDGKYKDGRHPEKVTFTPSLTEDLKRRDFTINAMAYNEKEGLVDLYGGLEDIRNRKIRCVGEAKERFGEDALRMMRAVRFSAQLGYDIEDKTMEAIRMLATNMKKISAERIAAELNKLMESDHPDYVEKLYTSGICDVVLPEFSKAMQTPQNHPSHGITVGEHSLRAMTNVPPQKELRLTMLFHDIGKPIVRSTDAAGVDHFYGHAEAGAGMAEKILRRLRYDNHTIDVVKKLVFFHDYGIGTRPDARMVRRAVNKIGEELFPMLLIVRRADILAQNEDSREEKLEVLSLWEELYQELLKKQDCVSLKDLALSGKDLIAMGMEPGREIGETLQMLLEYVLEEPERNRKEVLLKYVPEVQGRGRKEVQNISWKK